MKNKKSIFLIILGILLFLIGVFQSVILKEPHYFTLFSIGLFLILFPLYSNFLGKSLFFKWKNNKIALFFVLVLISSIIIDYIAIKLGYWIYPKYDSFFDEFLKYIFEWTIPLINYMIIFLLGVKLFSKYNSYISVILSLVTFVFISGLVSEYVNSFSLSWQILKMPLLDYNFGVFNLCFVTIGYWLMALIPYRIYSFVRGLR